MPIPIIDDIAQARSGILKRVPLDEISVPPALLDRIAQTFGERLTPAAAVDRILSDVRARGDAALAEWGQRLDGYEGPLEVPRAAIDSALLAIDPELRRALEQAATEIERFHQRQARNSWVDFGVEGALGQIVRPLQRVGIYVPGGSAPLPSSLLMAAIPARVAGVEEIIVCSPPQRGSGAIDTVVLAAANRR
jgi:histidinol dehydrogenase